MQEIISKLLEENYFTVPRTAAEVAEVFGKKGYTVVSTQIQKLAQELTRSCRNGLLEREKISNRWAFRKRITKVFIDEQEASERGVGPT